MSVNVGKGGQQPGGARRPSLARFAGVLLDDQDTRVERVLTDRFWQQAEPRQPASVVALRLTKTSDHRSR